MNISPDGMTVRFKTEPKERFEAEKSGAKPNTVRIIDAYEADLIRRKPPGKIIIQHQQEIFLRTLTDIHLNYNVLGKVIAIFSWTNKTHHHPMHDEKGRDHKAHTMSLNEGEQELSPHQHTRPQGWLFEDCNAAKHAPIAIAKTMRCPDCDGDLLKSRPGEFAKCSICRALFCLDPGVETPPATEELDAGFVAIGISKQMFNTLQNSFPGRTMNSIVQELYETYLYKLAKERGALYD